VREGDEGLNQPTLSVVIANYNHANYISDALQAILEQTWQPSEIIIVDDCSTDNSLEVIENFVRQSPLIRWVRNEQNQGANASFNRGAELASGEYITFPSADDRLLQGFIERSLLLLAQYPEAGLCCSHPAFLDDATGAIDKHEDWFRPSDKPCYLSPEELIKIVSPHRLWIAGHTCIVKRELFLQAGGYRPELKWYSDWFVFHAIAFRHGICYIPEALAAFRVLSNSYSAARQKDLRSEHEVLKNLLDLLHSAQYQDLVPAFVTSQVLARLPFVRTALKYPHLNPYRPERILG
jgi:glycosyltransferase involved in cell wall biosynthesis